MGIPIKSNKALNHTHAISASAMINARDLYSSVFPAGVCPGNLGRGEKIEEEKLMLGQCGVALMGNMKLYHHLGESLTNNATRGIYLKLNITEVGLPNVCPKPMT